MIDPQIDTQDLCRMRQGPLFNAISGQSGIKLIILSFMILWASNLLDFSVH